MAEPTINDLLTIYAVGSAISHTAAGAKWLVKTVDTERKAILVYHVRHHKKPIKKCSQDSCQKL